MKGTRKVSVIAVRFALPSVVALVVSVPIAAEAAPVLTVPAATYQNVVRVTEPNSLVLEQDSTTGSGGLLIDGGYPPGSPIPVVWTASTSNNYFTPSLRAGVHAGNGVVSQAGSDLTYYVEFAGNAGTVPITVSAYGEANAFALDGAEGPGDPQDNTATAFLEIYQASNFFNQVLSVAATTDEASANPGTKLFSIDQQQYNFEANTVYEVVMSANAHAAYLHDATAFVDPLFVAPAGYTIVTSEGVGNNPPVSATPLPAALPLFTSALGGLGLFGWRRKSKATASAA